MLPFNSNLQCRPNACSGVLFEYSKIPDIGMLVRGRVHQVQREIITLETGAELPFDYLVLAPGSTYAGAGSRFVSVSWCSAMSATGRRTGSYINTRLHVSHALVSCRIDVDVCAACAMAGEHIQNRAVELSMHSAHCAQTTPSKTWRAARRSGRHS